VLQTIINAIRNREYLAFTYSGYSRIVQPAAVGISRDGNQALRCYQTAGGHVKPGHEWDFCLLSKISGLRTTGEHFVADPPGYKKDDKHMSTIYSEL
jgi:hypothetical protein